jgi:hypothetical protein
MGAVGAGGSLAYQESLDFTIDPTSGVFLLDLLDNSSLGTGFDSATFQILLNGSLVEGRSFDSLGSAQMFFSNNLIDFGLNSGANKVQLVFDETMSISEGFSFNYDAGAIGFNYGAGGIGSVPEASTWVMMLAGFAGLGLAGYRTRRAVSIAA